MSNILVLTLGTRGDVQPYVALALGLRQAGHEVTLATAERYADFVRGYGVTCAPFAAQMLDMIDQAEGAKVIAGKNKLAMLGMVRKVIPMMRRMIDDIWQLCAQVRPDLILYHPKIWMGTDLAEKLGVPAILAALQPDPRICQPATHGPFIGVTAQPCQLSPVQPTRHRALSRPHQHMAAANFGLGQSRCRARATRYLCL